LIFIRNHAGYSPCLQSKYSLSWDFNANSPKRTIGDSTGMISNHRLVTFAPLYPGSYILVYRFVFFIIQLVAFSAIAGNPEIDSLKAELRKATGNEKEITLLNSLAWVYVRTDPDSALYFSQIAVTSSKNFSNTELHAGTYYTHGIIFRKNEINDSAYYYLLKALDLFEKAGNAENKIITLIDIGDHYRASHELEKAATAVRKAIHSSLLLRIPDHLPYAYNRLGAIVYERSFNHAFTDSIFTDSFAKAIRCIDSSFHWSDKTNIHKFHSSNYNILGACYMHLKEYQKASKYLIEALTDAEITDKPIIYRNIGMNFYKLGEFEKANTMALSGVSLADSIRQNSSLWQNYYLLYLIGEKTNDDKKALYYLKRADSLQSIVFNENIAIKTKEFETRFRQKENALLIQQQLSELQRKDREAIFMLVILSFIIAALLLVLYLILRILKTNTLLKKKNVAIELADTELKNLVQFKEDLTGMIVHDLKNPLNTIINYSQIHRQKGKFEEHRKINEIINIEIAAKKMLGIVNTIIDLQKWEEAKITLSFSQNSLNHIIASSLQNVNLLLRQKNISIQNMISHSIQLECDEDLIESVLVNLLTNAIKFSPNNKSITIRSVTESGFVRILIIDEGPGIPADKIPLLFKKYARAEIRKIGLSTSSGLGLAFSKIVIEAHQGQIGVESEPGKGSCFWFSMKYVKINKEADLINPEIPDSRQPFSNDFSNSILPLKRELANCKYYETGKIFNSLNSFKCSCSEFILWKSEVENAVLYNNDENYRKLIGNEEG